MLDTNQTLPMELQVEGMEEEEVTLEDSLITEPLPFEHLTSMAIL